VPHRAEPATQPRRRRFIAAALLAVAAVIAGAIAWKLHGRPDTTAQASPVETPLVSLTQRLDARLHREIASGTVFIAENPERTELTLSFNDMFAPGDSAVPSSFHPMIVAVGEEMASLPLNADIAGYTDSRLSKGGRISNRALSEARAESVERLLLVAGVSPDRLTVAGKGDANPRSDNATDEGRTKNRRVEITVTSAGHRLPPGSERTSAGPHLPVR
jgi:type VI secretion system protein ImpK